MLSENAKEKDLGQLTIQIQTPKQIQSDRSAYFVW